MNCRLPQTPRTPTAAAAHYFDDTFTHSSSLGSDPPRIRRSSTSRSIGRRGSFNASIADDRLDDFDDEALENRERRRSVANEHIASYVSQAIERVRSDDQDVSYNDELETSLHGK